MKQSEIVPALLAGHKLAVGQFRDFEVKSFPSKTNANESTVIATTFVLVGREVVSVQTFGERGKSIEAMPRPVFKPGDNVVIKFRDWTTTKYGVRVSGSCESFA